MRFANEEADLAGVMAEATALDKLLLQNRERQRMGELMRLRPDKFIGTTDSQAAGLGWDGTQPVEAFAFG
jgi:hypothetical protein